jgi:tRNA dimethylallyltransferase
MTAATAPLAARLLCLAGPTASGKSAVALCLAEWLGGEIVSVDSMQVYRGLDLGTAKPTPAERTRVPHHLVDMVDLREPFDAARWRALADLAIREVCERGRRPIFCGGTGLYYRALIEGLSELPSADAGLRTALEATPLTELLRELEAGDPITFARMDRQNPRRVIRAVEVLRLTGRPLSEQRTAKRVAPLQSADQAALLVLGRAPEDLQARIERRVEQMFADGLVEETRRLLGQGLPENRIAMQALGYRQVVEHLRGERGLAETIALVKTRTRQFARRQRTWFRHQAGALWLEVPAGETPEATARRVLAVVG